jgi:hypothetical protein
MITAVYTPLLLRTELARLLADELGEYRLPGLSVRFAPSIYVGDPPDGTRLRTEKLEVIIPKTPVQSTRPTSDGTYLYETWPVVLRQHNLELSTQNAIYVILQNFRDIRPLGGQQIKLPNKRTVEQRIVNFRQLNFVEDK